MKICIFSLLVLCYSFPTIAAELQFESDVRVKKTDQLEFISIKAGEKLTLKRNESYIVVNSQSLPMVIFSPINDNSEVLITDKNIQQTLDEQISKTLSSRTNEIIDGLRKAESHLIKKDYPQALALATSLKDKYPQVSSVLFFRATTLSLMNNRKEALSDLEKGLTIDPQSAAALALQKRLKEAQ
ncbi:MAG: hypothetical protein K2Q26_11900 [Bdellovibrionales bacterium]|nr:hypothetical protein [Bdellovibrionales bacterium]